MFNLTNLRRLKPSRRYGYYGFTITPSKVLYVSKFMAEELDFSKAYFEQYVDEKYLAIKLMSDQSEWTNVTRPKGAAYKNCHLSISASLGQFGVKAVNNTVYLPVIQQDGMFVFDMQECFIEHYDSFEFNPETARAIRIAKGMRK